MYNAIKIENGRPIKREIIPTNSLPPGYDVVWTEQEWEDWKNQQQPTIEPVYSKDYIHSLAERYQDLYYDNKGMLFLSDLKTTLVFTLGVNVTSNLTYQMIESVNRWVNKVWAKAFEFDYMSISLLQTPSLDYNGEVGLPPCSFRDILWTVDTQFQALEPNRPVNTDINYYISWS